MFDVNYYLKLKYNINIKSLSHDLFVAEINDIPGLCGYGSSEIEALQELEIVKETAFQLMLEQGKSIPIPSLKIEIPIDDFNRLPYKDELTKYVLV